MSAALGYRDVRIFPPRLDEVPGEFGDGCNVDDVRVAKLNGRVIGAYRLARTVGGQVQIQALAVCPAHRRQGVGRWLLRHAIGIAEARGGRVVEAPRGAPAAFLQDSGFECEGGTFRLRLTPE